MKFGKTMIKLQSLKCMKCLHVAAVVTKDAASVGYFIQLELQVQFLLHRGKLHFSKIRLHFLQLPDCMCNCIYEKIVKVAKCRRCSVMAVLTLKIMTIKFGH